ncbi:MAG: O-antigen ligase family protein [Candidatus Zixiibacteriota bacterium]|nr:MAG: O-antigen ligase family protein [candidate division Zixibacteria bacterium]
MTIERHNATDQSRQSWCSPLAILTAAVDLVLLAALSLLGPIPGVATLAGICVLGACFAASSGLLGFIVLTSHITGLPGLNSDLLYVLKWTVTLLLLGILIARKSISGQSQDWRIDTIGKFFIAYSAWIVVCSLFAQRPIDTLTEAVRVMGLWIVYEVAVSTITSKRSLQLLLYATLATVLASFLYSASGWLEGSFSRFAGFLVKPNPYGTYLVFTIPLLILAVILSRKRASRLLFGFGVLIGVTALLLSWSRAAWFALLVEIVLFSILERKKWILTSIVAVALSAVVLLLSSPRIYMMADTIGRLSTGTSHRSIRWEKGFEAGFASPVVGYGFHYQNQDIMGRVSWGDYVEATVFHDREASFDPHNVYIHTLLMGGFPLITIFLALSVHLLRSQYKKYRTAPNKRERVLHSIMIAMIAGALVNGFFERNLIFGMGATNNYFWIALGMVTAISSKKLLSEPETSIDTTRV